MSVSSPTLPVGSFTREAFAAHLERVKHLPAWWLDRKRAAYERFASLPMPKRTDEGWRISQRIEEAAYSTRLNKLGIDGVWRKRT